LDEVDASGTLASITVEGSIGLDEVRDVGNVNANFERAVILGFDGKSVIEITSVTGVDSEDSFSTKVTADINFTVGDSRARIEPLVSKSEETRLLERHWRDAFDDIVRELLGGEVAILQESAGLNFDVADRTELFHESTEGMKRTDRLWKVISASSKPHQGQPLTWRLIQATKRRSA
jgi:hypothetical protein